jgi:hypothetical protein
LKERWEDEEEEVSSYLMTLNKQEDTGNFKQTHWIAVSRELALEILVDFS